MDQCTLFSSCNNSKLKILLTSMRSLPVMRTRLAIDLDVVFSANMASLIGCEVSVILVNPYNI